MSEGLGWPGLWKMLLLFILRWYSWYGLAPVDRGVQLQHHVTLVVLDEK
jgi:hypothetical protein